MNIVESIYKHILSCRKNPSKIFDLGRDKYEFPFTYIGHSSLSEGTKRYADLLQEVSVNLEGDALHAKVREIIQ
jgi:hypothetical protein